MCLMTYTYGDSGEKVEISEVETNSCPGPGLSPQAPRVGAHPWLGAYVTEVIFPSLSYSALCSLKETTATDLVFARSIAL